MHNAGNASEANHPKGGMLFTSSLQKSKINAVEAGGLEVPVGEMWWRSRVSCLKDMWTKHRF